MPKVVCMVQKIICKTDPPFQMCYRPSAAGGAICHCLLQVSFPRKTSVVPFRTIDAGWPQRQVTVTYDARLQSQIISWPALKTSLMSSFYFATPVHIANSIGDECSWSAVSLIRSCLYIPCWIFCCSSYPSQLCSGYEAPCRLDDWGRSSSPDGVTDFYFCISSTRIWGPPNLPSNGYRGLFPPGVKLPELEADNSPPTSAEVLN
jgi:hypothetical protein